jgi:hypothetical protein
LTRRTARCEDPSIGPEAKKIPDAVHAAANTARHAKEFATVWNAERSAAG